MKTIIVNVYDSKDTTKEIQVVTQDGKPTILEAGKGVNYGFFDKSIDRAPNHIVNKRIDNDLHISFERKAQEPDLIIENFYGNEDQALIGIAENGEYYYYIPDTGEIYDYVTQLEMGAVEGHALGGKNIAQPVWAELAAGGIPWWLGILGLGLASVPFLLDNDKDNETETETTPPITQTSEAPVGIDKNVDFIGDTVVIGLKCCVTDADGDRDLSTIKLIDPTTNDKVTELNIASEGAWKVDGANGNIIFTPETNFVGTPTPINYVVSDKAGNESDPSTINLISDNATPTTLNTVLALSDATIDTSALSNTTGVKTLDLDNDITQELTISLADIVKITADNNTLFIDGDAEDTVNLTGMKADASDTTGYDMYTGNGATIYIDVEISNVVM